MISEACSPDEASVLQAYYVARAGEYERIYAKPERQADLRRLRRAIPARLAGRQVLEIACGTGWWTGPIAERARSVFAIDAPDDRYVAGSSTPVSAPDATGDTWQHRRLDDGSAHRVLKNFPTQATLEAALGSHGRSLAWHLLDYYWWCEYRTASE